MIVIREAAAAVARDNQARDNVDEEESTDTSQGDNDGNETNQGGVDAEVFGEAAAQSGELAVSFGTE
ncbi:hypothetical protein D3C72_2406430 [compost metagenome]